MKRIVVLITTIFILILVSGCATSFTNNHRLNMEPLFNYDKNIDKNSSELDALGPFFTLQSEPQEREYGFRPLFYVREKGNANFKEVEFLFPLGKYRKTNEERVFQFIPLFSSHKDLTEDSNKPSDFGFFPIFWGKDEEGKKYGGFFPIYGRLNNRFGKDQIRFFLWPIYSDSKEDDSWTYNILWPIFSYTKGGDKSGFRVWPLYGKEEKKGEYSKYFALWPIFFLQNTDLDTDNPKKFKAIFPLFIATTSPQKDSRTFLWPFFSYTNDRANNYKQWDMPWPIFHYSKGEGIKSFKFFPLYGYKIKPDSETSFFLWPLYKYEKEFLEDHEDTTYRFLLINKYQKKVWRGHFKEAKSFRIWPLFYYDKKEDGSVKFSFPELIPIDNEGFERNWAPLFRLYHYKGDADGNMESKFLWGLYRHKKMDSREFYELSFLLSYEKEENKMCFSVLKGLFEYRQKNNLNSIKLFYLPPLIKWESLEEDKKEPLLPVLRRLENNLVYEGIEQGD
ncbi:MAG: hypothetical protein ABIJ37_06085 [Pseudomonadota bacterium]